MGAILPRTPQRIRSCSPRSRPSQHPHPDSVKSPLSPRPRQLHDLRQRRRLPPRLPYEPSPLSLLARISGDCHYQPRGKPSWQCRAPMAPRGPNGRGGAGSPPSSRQRTNAAMLVSLRSVMTGPTGSVRCWSRPSTTGPCGPPVRSSLPVTTALSLWHPSLTPGWESTAHADLIST